MRVRVSGRSSDLSRSQIGQVAAAIRAAAPMAEVVTSFSESLGDRMLDDPLWAMPQKGVFTEDFVEDLRAHRTDVVVHSWKDLPTEERAGTRVVATLPRADVRDVLLMRRDRWSGVTPGGTIQVLTSSPRRAYNLAAFLTWALPVPGLNVEFVPVRGNVPTRVRKLIEGQQHALVVAKAALDRLLTDLAPEMQATRDAMRAGLERCRWMILPVSANPAAAAQGALALEVATDGDPEVLALTRSLNDPPAFDDATREREILRAYGGGCHQRIGVTVLSRPYGKVVSVRGLTDSGERLERFQLETQRRTPRAPADAMCPPLAREPRRDAVPAQQPDAECGLWLARADALPEQWDAAESVVWTAGLQTWRRLAARGLWVNGSAEGLGEREAPRADVLAGRTIPWVKLTHDAAPSSGEGRSLATYRLSYGSDERDLSAFTHFYWSSGSQFLDALRRYPAIRSGWQACGPGHTWSIVRDALGSEERLEVWLSREDWLREVRG